MEVQVVSMCLCFWQRCDQGYADAKDDVSAEGHVHDQRYIDDNVVGLDDWIITMFLQRKMAKNDWNISMITFLTKDILMIMLI